MMKVQKHLTDISQSLSYFKASPPAPFWEFDAMESAVNSSKSLLWNAFVTHSCGIRKHF